MNWFRQAFTRGKIYSDLAEEMRLHLEEKIETLIEGGMGREAAEFQAKREFGNSTLLEERSREVWQWPTLESLCADAKYAMRQLRKSPGFTLTAVLTLALGIGANAVVFSILNALVLRPLNVPQAQNLYAIEFGKDHSPHHSYLDYLDLRDRNRSLDGLVAYGITPAGMDINGSSSRIWLYLASGNYFDVLRVQPYLGRFFHGSDEHGPNSSPYIVLSYAFWRSHFQSDPGVVGRAVQLNKHPFTILGVAPPEFRGTELFLLPDLWMPVVNLEQIEGCCGLTSRSARGLELVGRLNSGMTPAQLTADLNSIAVSLAKTYPKEDESLSFSLARPGLLGNTLGKPVRAFVTGLMLLAALILLAVCANLGSLFAARAADRTKEVALRLALGSSHGRILRQLLTESILISIVGGMLGLAGSVALLHWLSAWQPVPHIPITVPVNPDPRTYVVALLLALVSGILFGLVPVRRVLRTDPYQIIKAGSTGVAGTRRFTPRDLLLAVQIAICAVLVTASLVAVRGLVRSLHSNFGFTADNAMLVTTELSMAGYSDDQAPITQRRMLDAIEAIPGVAAAGYADRLPLGLSWNSSLVFADTTTDLKTSNAAADTLKYRISPGYFSAAGTTLLAGRNLTWHDDKNSPQVAVVNQEFARKVFGSIDKAIGRYYKTEKGARVQFVGVTEDGKYTTLTENPRPAVFVPFLQSSTTDTWLVVRSNRDPQQLAGALDRTLHGVDVGLPLAIDTWHKQLDSALFASRAATIALGVLGGIGAMLAVTGIFGMAAYSVSKRLRELGIRIALGAQRNEVLQAALGKAFRLLAYGSAAGLLLGIAATRVLSSIVYQATPRDPLVLAGVVLTMVLLGLLATWIPAQRALATDPLMLLREE
jgi:predicted permease